MNETLLHRINRIESEMVGDMDLRAIATHRICDECETVAHCSKHGCVPKRPIPARELGVEAALPPSFTNEPQPSDDPPTPSLRWFLVAIAVAFVLVAIFSVH